VTSTLSESCCRFHDPAPDEQRLVHRYPFSHSSIQPFAFVPSCIQLHTLLPPKCHAELSSSVGCHSLDESELKCLFLEWRTSLHVFLTRPRGGGGGAMAGGFEPDTACTLLLPLTHPLLPLTKPTEPLADSRFTIRILGSLSSLERLLDLATIQAVTSTVVLTDSSSSSTSSSEDRSQSTSSLTGNMVAR